MPSFHPRSHTSSSFTKRALRKQHVPSHPTNLTRNDQKAIQNAIDAFHHLSDDIRIMNANRKETTLIMSAEFYNRFWVDGILDWSLYLFNHYNPSPDMRWEVISYISCVLAHFIKIDGVHIMEERCLSLAHCLWAERQYDSVQSEYSSTRGWWEPFLYFVGRCGDRSSDPDSWNADLLILAFKNGSTIDLMIKRLETGLQTLDDTSDNERTLIIRALSKLLPFYNEPQPGFIQHIAKIVQYILTQILPGQFSHGVLHDCFTLISLLTFHLLNANSIYTYRVAIRYGLFRIITSFSKYLNYVATKFGHAPERIEPIMQQVILCVFIDIGPKYMRYQSIQKALLPIAENDEYASAVRGTMLEEKWENFRQRFEQSVLVINEPTFPPISLCDNLMHGTSNTPEKLYRCSGCESTWYCSTNCQRSHWKNGHRDLCTHSSSGLPPTNSSAFRPLQRCDHISVLRFAIRAVGTEWDTICQKIAAREFDPPTSYAFVVDYTRHPEEINIVARNETAVQVGTAMPNATIVQCRVPLGPFVATLTSAGDISKGVDGVWFGGRSLTTYDYVPMMSLRDNVETE